MTEEQKVEQAAANAVEVEQAPSGVLAVPSAQELLPAVLEPPQGVDAEQVRTVEDEARNLLEAILKDPDDRATARHVSSVGNAPQSRASEDFKLLRTSLGQVMDRMRETGQSSSLPADLNKLRTIMDDINPYPAIEQMKKARTAGFLSRLFRSVPGVGKVLSDIARRYESVQTQVDAVIQSLESGTDKLLENSLELEERYKSLKELQLQVKLAAYQLQVLLRELEQAKPNAQDELREKALAMAETRAIRRLQNLKVTENAFAQFFVTINTTLDNHENLRDAVRSMINLVRPVLENGLALQIAQQEEKQIAQALEATQDYLGQLMVSVAQESMDNAAEVARITNQPLVRFQDLLKAYNILSTRMEETQKIEAQMLETAKENINQLDTITGELEKHAQAQETGREAVRNL